MNCEDDPRNRSIEVILNVMQHNLVTMATSYFRECIKSEVHGANVLFHSTF